MSQVNTPFVCPTGHKLPHRSRFGECTPMRCGSLRSDRADEQAMRTGDIEDKLETAEKVERSKVAIAKTKVRARAKEMELDLNVSPAELDNWTRAQLAEMLPLAVAEARWRLLMGSDKERWEVAQDVFDRTGHAKGEKSNIGGAVIILSGSMSLPWAQGTPNVQEQKPSSAVVEAQRMDSSSAASKTPVPDSITPDSE